MRLHLVTLTACLSVIGTTASAGCIIPMPGAGVAGPIALLVACAAVAGVKFARNRRSK